MLRTEWRQNTYFLVILIGLLKSCSSNPMVRALTSSSLDENQKPNSPTDIDYDKLLHSLYESSSSEENLPEELKKHLEELRGVLPMMYSGSSLPLADEDKRAERNFLRFGRGPEKNFLRFGKATPLTFGLGIQEDASPEQKEEVKRGNPRNFLRFGRDNLRNFIRFGRASGRNFIRFGRSVDNKQLKDECPDCFRTVRSTPITSQSLQAKESTPNTSSGRPKRSAPPFYDEMLFLPATPLSWNDNIIGGSESTDPTQNRNKRAHQRNFVRYGRDPLDLHFLRFGKRSFSEESQEHDDSEENMERMVRSRAVKNFLRFG